MGRRRAGRRCAGASAATPRGGAGTRPRQAAIEISAGEWSKAIRSSIARASESTGRLDAGDRDQRVLGEVGQHRACPRARRAPGPRRPPCAAPCGRRRRWTVPRSIAGHRSDADPGGEEGGPVLGARPEVGVAARGAGPEGLLVGEVVEHPLALPQRVLVEQVEHLLDVDRATRRAPPGTASPPCASAATSRANAEDRPGQHVDERVERVRAHQDRGAHHHRQHQHRPRQRGRAGSATAAPAGRGPRRAAGRRTAVAGRPRPAARGPGRRRAPPRPWCRRAGPPCPSPPGVAAAGAPATVVPLAEPSSWTTGRGPSSMRACRWETSGSVSLSVQAAARPRVAWPAATCSPGAAVRAVDDAEDGAGAGRCWPAGLATSRGGDDVDQVTGAQPALGEPSVGRPELAAVEGDQQQGALVGGQVPAERAGQVGHGRIGSGLDGDVDRREAGLGGWSHREDPALHWRPPRRSSSSVPIRESPGWSGLSWRPAPAPGPGC